MKIMFICTGNICRSAMAHAMLSKLAKEQNKNIEVYSAGIFAKDGEKPTNEAKEVMRTYGVDLSSHIATNIKNSKIEEMDIILCATMAHKFNIINMYPNLKEKIFTIKEYAKGKSNDLNIEDPWNCGIESYRKCAEELQSSINEILKKI